VVIIALIPDFAFYIICEMDKFNNRFADLAKNGSSLLESALPCRFQISRFAQRNR
jgi:hypothetical protein